jgi:hypothetical protein
MDHRRALAALLIGLAALAAGPAPEPAHEPALREARWIVPDQRLGLLTMPPIACIRPSRDAPEHESRSVGETAFRTPLLLGGQAARAGLSCASCHINGRSNHGFSFPGVSGVPGTADVTSSVLSSHRGDGQFNPKRIPDLALDPPKVSRALGEPALPSFIRGLIVAEFDGPEPSPAVLNGLADYVRGLRREGCTAQGNSPVTLASESDALLPALRAANAALKRGDRPTANLMIAGARATLGRLYERYQPAYLADERAAILKMDAQLQVLQSVSPTAMPDGLAAEIDALQRLLSKRESRSLYNRKLLAKALK